MPTPPSSGPAPTGAGVAPQLERCPADTDVAKLAEVMQRDGGIILEGLVSPADAARIDADLAPAVAQRTPGFIGEYDDAFYGANTVRVQGVPSRSRTFVDAILMHPTLLALADAMLLPYCGDYWMSQAETIFIGPGEPEQELHRDDVNWSFAARLGIDLQMSVLTALGDYDAEVGATMVIPATHRDGFDAPFDAAAAQPAELGVGDALVYLGSLVHGGGHNRTADRVRKGLYCSYLLGWLTPEEAPALSLRPEVAATLPLRARELLGWSSMRGNPRTAVGAEAALHVWQLDRDDLARFGGSFTNR
ncbi:MAG: phytanoyl-CoA dioxygenase family protein [Microthrixaceae bacterium]|jgi:ectoine hydroxylase-related dioxygenase (phytanoyl-CoA dioxygenase family)